jgi:hypothetical protein
MGGFRSLLARWLGGAGADTTHGGLRSLFAFWSGGASISASSAANIAPEPIASTVSFGSPIIAVESTEPEAVDDGSGWELLVRPSPHAVRGRLRIALRVGVSGVGHVEPVAARGTLKIAGRIALNAVGRVDNSLPEQIAEEDELLLLIV